MSNHERKNAPGDSSEIVPMNLGEARRRINEIVLDLRKSNDHDKRYQVRVKIGEIVGQFARGVKLPKGLDQVRIHNVRTGSSMYGAEYDEFVYNPLKNSLQVWHGSPSAVLNTYEVDSTETNRPEDWINYGWKIPGKLVEVAEKTAVS